MADILEGLNISVPSAPGTHPSDGFDWDLFLTQPFEAANQMPIVGIPGVVNAASYGTLQLALAELPSGGVLLIPPGTYTLTTPLEIVSNTWLCGEAGAVIQGASLSTLIHGSQVDNVRITGLQLIGDGSGNSEAVMGGILLEFATRLDIQDCEFDSFGGDAIAVGLSSASSSTALTDIHIARCHVKDYNRNGIGIYYGGKVFIERCEIRRSPLFVLPTAVANEGEGYGIRVIPAAATLALPVIAAQNIIDSPRKSGIRVDVNSSEANRWVAIRNNITVSPGLSGVEYYALAGSGGYHSIKDNTVLGFAANGLYISGADGLLLSDNVVISASSSDGIDVISSQGACLGGNVSLPSSGVGIYLSKCPDAQLSGNHTTSIQVDASDNVVLGPNLATSIVYSGSPDSPMLTGETAPVTLDSATNTKFMDAAGSFLNTGGLDIDSAGVIQAARKLRFAWAAGRDIMGGVAGVIHLTTAVSPAGFPMFSQWTGFGAQPEAAFVAAELDVCDMDTLSPPTFGLLIDYSHSNQVTSTYTVNIMDASTGQVIDTVNWLVDFPVGGLTVQRIRVVTVPMNAGKAYPNGPVVITVICIYADPIIDLINFNVDGMFLAYHAKLQGYS